MTARKDGKTARKDENTSEGRFLELIQEILRELGVCTIGEKVYQSPVEAGKADALIWIYNKLREFPEVQGALASLGFEVESEY